MARNPYSIEDDDPMLRQALLDQMAPGQPRTSRARPLTPGVADVRDRADEYRPLGAPGGAANSYAGEAGGTAAPRASVSGSLRAGGDPMANTSYWETVTSAPQRRDAQYRPVKPSKYDGGLLAPTLDQIDIMRQSKIRQYYGVDPDVNEKDGRELIGKWTYGDPAPNGWKYSDDGLLKKKGSVWGKIGKVAAIAAPIAATIATGGAASPWLAATVGAGAGAASGALSGGGWKGALLGGALGGVGAGAGSALANAGASVGKQIATQAGIGAAGGAASGGGVRGALIGAGLGAAGGATGAGTPAATSTRDALVQAGIGAGAMGLGAALGRGGDTGGVRGGPIDLTLPGGETRTLPAGRDVMTPGGLQRPAGGTDAGAAPLGGAGAPATPGASVAPGGGSASGVPDGWDSSKVASGHNSPKYAAMDNLQTLSAQLQQIPDEAGRKALAEETLRGMIPEFEASSAGGAGKVLEVRGEKILFDANDGKGPIWIDAIQDIEGKALPQWLVPDAGDVEASGAGPMVPASAGADLGVPGGAPLAGPLTDQSVLEQILAELARIQRGEAPRAELLSQMRAA